MSIAAFFNQQLTTPNQLTNFMEDLSKCNLQIIMLQDGVGVNHLSLENISEYYKAAATGIFDKNTEYKGEFWTDLETFAFPEAPDNTIDRIKVQLQSELSVEKVNKAVSFQYYSDMSPNGPGRTKAAQLRNDYVGYLKSLK